MLLTQTLLLLVISHLGLSKTWSHCKCEFDTERQSSQCFVVPFHGSWEQYKIMVDNQAKLDRSHRYPLGANCRLDISDYSNHLNPWIGKRLTFFSVQDIHMVDNLGLEDIQITRSRLKQMIKTPQITGLKTLNLSHNMIQRLHRLNNQSTLSASIQSIDLSHNRISIISPDFFSDLPLLSYLNLSDNNLRMIGLKFTVQVFSSILIFSNNPKLYQVEELFLNGSKFTSFMVSFGNTSLTEIPSFQLVNTKSVYLFTSYYLPEKLEITRVINATRNSDQITTIEVSMTNMSHFTDDCFEQKNLSRPGIQPTRLILDNNAFKKFPNISSLTSLESLSLKHNKIRDLDDYSLMPRSIRDLDLSFNEIDRVNLSFFQNLHKLTSLSLSNNRLKLLEIKMRPGELNKLSFANNQLQSAHFYFNSSSTWWTIITELDLSGNNFSKFPTFSGFVRLIGQLKMNNQNEGNNLSAAFDNFGNYNSPGIGILDLSNNSVRHLNSKSEILRSTLIAEIELGHNHLDALNVCDIEYRVNRERENTNRSSVRVNMHPQTTESFEWPLVCNFLVRMKFDAGNGAPPKLRNCAEFEGRYFSSGACEVIENKRSEFIDYLAEINATRQKFLMSTPVTYELQGVTTADSDLQFTDRLLGFWVGNEIWIFIAFLLFVLASILLFWWIYFKM